MLVIEMSRVYLVRHGQTDWNFAARFQGQKDVALNQIGQEQRACVREYFKNKDIAAVFSSDLSRAADTAKDIAQDHHLSLETFPQLREINFGQWEGLNFKQIFEQFPREAELWNKDIGSLSIPQGESFVQASQRCVEIYEQIVAPYKDGGKQIVIVCHGAVIRLILNNIMGAAISKIWHWRQNNACINIIDYNKNRPIIDTVNYTEHLK